MTHKKIAELANVSVSTVSKALSGSKEVNPSLAAKIRHIAVETGYFKEKSKRKLDNIRSGGEVIAVICPEIVSVHYSEMVSNIQRHVEKRGGKVLVCMYDFDRQKLCQTIESLEINRDADGIVVFDSYGKDVSSSLPMVFMGTSEAEDVTCVYNDGQAIMNDIVDYLVDMGHTRIGYVGENHTITKNESFIKAVENKGIEFNADDFYVVSRRFEKIGFEAAEKMLEKGNLPTAIVTAYDEVAMGIISYLTDNGIKVPEDVSVIGINDIPFAAYSQIPLTTVSTHIDKKCEIMVELLYDILYRENTNPRQIYVEHTLVKRSSVKKIN